MGHLISFAGFLLTTFELRALSRSLQVFFDGSCLSQVCDAAFLFLLTVSFFDLLKFRGTRQLRMYSSFT